MLKNINFVLDNYLSVSGGTVTGDLQIVGNVEGTIEKAISDSLGNKIDTTYATKNEVKQQVANLVSSAPETLDTLKELADALGNDPNFATTVSNQIGTKANDDSVVHLSGAETISGVKTFSDTIKGNLSGNAATATTATKANQLTTARTIAIGGVVTGTATSFNGTANITIDTTAINLEDTGVSGELPISHGGTGRTDGKAVGLVTARTIDGVSFNGTANISHFGTCSTAAATAAKVVSCSGFTLATGARIIVQFTVTNSAASPTLNVNNTGAKAITYRNAAISAGYLAANRVYEFVYNGTNYELVGDINTDTNTDTKVTQTVTTTAAEFPIITTYTAAATANKTEGVRFCSAVTVNPSTKSITVGGNINGSKVYNAVWNDYAEFFPRGEETEPGDIIGLDLNSEEERYVKATLDTPPVGVHSSDFAHLIGGENPPSGIDYYDYNIKKYIPVGLAGRVKVKVIGPVKKGMKVIPSNIPGVGKVCDNIVDYDRIVGITVENNDDEDIKLVKIRLF